MNGTSCTSCKKKSKQQRRNGNRANTGQSVTSTLSKKQQAILNAPVKLGDEVLVTIHGIGSSGEGVGRVEDFTVFVPFALPVLLLKDLYTSNVFPAFTVVLKYIAYLFSSFLYFFDYSPKMNAFIKS